MNLKEKKRDVIVSDLTYVNVAGKWNYICLIINLFNRKIVGYATGKIRQLNWFIKHLQL